MEKYIITDKIVDRIPYINDNNYDFLKDDKIKSMFDNNTIINVLNYIEYDNIHFLQKNKYSSNYELFKFFNCHEKNILDIINDDKFKKLEEYFDKKKYLIGIPKELFNFIKNKNQTILSRQNIKNNIFSYMNINDDFRNCLEAPLFIKDYIVKNMDELIEIQNNEDVFNLTLDFEFKFDSGIFLPPNIVSLIMKSVNIDNPIPIHFLPETIREIYIEYYLCENTRKYTFPKNVRVIDFGDSCLYKFEKDALPNSLEEIYLGTETNTNLKDLNIPDNVKKLFLGRYHEKKIEKGDLPKKLEILKLGDFYNHEFEKNVLPKTLKYIEINEVFQYTDKLKEYYPDMEVDY
tara:strand:+ start:322 stop:1362 length:1041 start_codon:yes stop_codon:yes gene_type:complete